MKTKFFVLLITIFTTTTCVAQKKTYADSIGKALNTIIATLPDSCKSLWGERRATSYVSYESKIALPRSITSVPLSYQREQSVC